MRCVNSGVEKTVNNEESIYRKPRKKYYPDKPKNIH